MIRHVLPRLGAAAAALLLVLPMLGLPVRADEIEPEPDVEEEVAKPEPVVERAPEPRAEIETAAGAAEFSSARSKVFDVLILRPFGFATTVVGAAFFVPAALLTAPSGAASIRTAWEHFVVSPVENTFTRPLGDF